MKTFFLLWIAALASGACGSATEATDAAATTAGNADKSSCILAHQTKLDQLLPLASIQKHYTGDLSKAEKKYAVRPGAKRHDMDTYEYIWPGNRKRKMKMMGREIEYDVSNRIGLTWVGNDMFMMARKGTPVENFRFFYRNMSAQEKNEAFRKAGERMEQQGYDKKQTETAVNMGKELSKEELMYKSVEGIGDAAAWRIKEKSLIVLTGKTTFQVIADISENDDQNIALAKKLAAEVLNTCK